MEIPQFTFVIPSIAPLVGNFIPMVGYPALKPHGQPMQEPNPKPITRAAIVASNVFFMLSPFRCDVALSLSCTGADVFNCVGGLDAPG